MRLWPFAPHTLACGLEPLVVENRAVTVWVRWNPHHAMDEIRGDCPDCPHHKAMVSSRTTRIVYPPVSLQGRYPLFFQL